MKVKNTHVIGMREIIRIAILDNTERSIQLLQISKCLNCSIEIAKELYFAFLSNADDTYLQVILLREVNR